MDKFNAVYRNLTKKPWAFIRVPYLNPTILGYRPRASYSGSYITELQAEGVPWFAAPLSYSATIFDDLLVHGWDSIKNDSFDSFLDLSTHKHVKCHPIMTKIQGFILR